MVIPKHLNCCGLS